MKDQEIIDYLDFPSTVEATKRAKAIALQLLAPQPNEYILDAGCGLGDDSRTIASKVGPQGLVQGIDSSETVVNEAQRRSKNLALSLSYVLGNLEALPFPDSSFDGVLANRILHMLKEAKSAFNEMLRVLKPEGRIVLSEPDWGTLIVNSPYPKISKRILNHASAPWPNSMEGSDLYAAMKEAGLSKIFIVPHTGVFTCLDQAWRLLSLENNARYCLENGLVKEEEVLKWVEALLESDAKGQFFASLTGFIAFGVVPHQPKAHSPKGL